MSKTFLTGIDLKQNELQNARVHNVANDPSTGVKGQIIFNTTDNKFAVYNGTIWERMGSGSGEGHSYALSGSGVTVNLYEDGSTAAGSYTIPSATSSNPGVMTATQAAKLAGIAEGATANTGTVTQVSTSGAITGGPITTTGTISHSTSAGYKHIPSSGSANQYLKYGGSSGTAAWQSPDITPTSGSSNLITSDAVYDAINALPTPMQFKGTLGTGGTLTWADFDPGSDPGVGETYKVITDNQTYGAKVGDTVIGTDSSPFYVVIPSGDEPSGTVTNIATSGAITGGPITSTGTISHSTAAGYKHIPTSGSANQYLKYGGSSGTASWQSPDTTPTSSSSNLITSGAVKTALDSIVHPEQISRATFTIASGSSTGSVNIGSGKTVFAVTAIQSNAGVVADWSYSGSSVTVTLASNATAAVTVNVLYYGGGESVAAVQMDYVVEQGTQDYWTYRKWNSGIAECWGTSYTTASLGSRNAKQGSFPTGLFTAGPVLNANCLLIATTSAQVNYTETSSTGWTVYVYGDGSGSVDCHLDLQAIGRWK